MLMMKSIKVLSFDSEDLRRGMNASGIAEFVFAIAYDE